MTFCQYKKNKKTFQKNKSNLDINTLILLKDLFNFKGWDIDEDGDISYFNRYVKTLNSLEKPQQEFFLDLSSRFLHIPASEYLEKLIHPLRNLRTEDPDAELLFACCLPKEDIGSTKSSHMVLYQLKGCSIKSKINLFPFHVIEKWDVKNLKRLKKPKVKVVLVDDFIGTGDTALSAIDYIQELYPEITNSQINILCIVTMKEGMELLVQHGYKIYPSLIIGKGITDFFEGDEYDAAIKNMQKIEATIKKLNYKFKFGYLRSEALVCMERCPNNTFPIYWRTSRIAPYER